MYFKANKHPTYSTNLYFNAIKKGLNPLMSSFEHRKYLRGGLLHLKPHKFLSSLKVSSDQASFLSAMYFLLLLPLRKSLLLSLVCHYVK